MTKAPLTVIDKHGKAAVRPNGALLDGDRVRVSIMLMDGTSGTGAADAEGSAIRAAGARILGDAWNEADYAGLSDEAARQAIVKRRLGAVADTQSAAFLDGAWKGLAGDAAAQPVLSSAESSIGRQGVRLALANHAARGGDQVRDSQAPADFAMTDADRAQHHEARQQRTAELADAWMTLEARAVKDSGQPYEERMSNRWKGAA